MYKLINFSFLQYRLIIFEMFLMLSSFILTTFFSNKSKKMRKKNIMILFFVECQIIKKKLQKITNFDKQ